jgi:16S rRNA processing protein RimM
VSEQLPTDEIVIGRVGKPHGIKGAFNLDGSIDFAALVPGFHLRLAGDPFTVESRGGTEKKPILKLNELTDRDATAARRGQDVTAVRQTLTPLAPGEFYAKDLVGRQVRDQNGNLLGIVDKIVNSPTVDILTVIDGSAELLIPMVGDAIVEIGEAAGDVGEVVAEIVVNADFLNF